MFFPFYIYRYYDTPEIPNKHFSLMEFLFYWKEKRINLLLFLSWSQIKMFSHNYSVFASSCVKPPLHSVTKLPNPSYLKPKCTMKEPKSKTSNLKKCKKFSSLLSLTAENNNFCHSKTFTTAFRTTMSSIICLNVTFTRKLIHSSGNEMNYVHQYLVKIIFIVFGTKLIRPKRLLPCRLLR